MIDKIINKLTPVGYSFLLGIDAKTACGRYNLDDGCYINIEEYMTCNRQERLYENHRKFIDYQYIIEGEEIIEIVDVYGLSLLQEYDERNDYSKYSNEHIGEKCIIRENEGVLIYPGQAHMPCLNVNDSHYVKKAVLKIPVNKLPRLFVMDIDGTLTDGTINIGENGEIFKSFNVKDGYGIAKALPQKGFVTAVITGRRSEIVEKRCLELGINHVIQGCNDKINELIKLAKLHGIYMNEEGILPRVVYIGDDIPDIECIESSELSGCPADAISEIKQKVDFISTQNGGCGAVREFIDWIIDDIV